MACGRGRIEAVITKLGGDGSTKLGLKVNLGWLLSSPGTGSMLMTGLFIYLFFYYCCCKNHYTTYLHLTHNS